MDACTIIARNYLPHARVLASSYLEHHPTASFTTLVIDEQETQAYRDEPFDVLTPYEIGIERSEFHRMALIYDVKELATAVKPALLATLLASRADSVAYLDPDIQVFAPLDDIGDLARRHGIVLTPHTTEPLPRDGLLPSEQMLMRAGIYNLGFIAIGPGSHAFLDWWSERLARDCLVAVEDGLFVDQRWVDFVPALFPHTILADPGCNVAYWNLAHRELVSIGDRWEVDGKPLRFFHFSGYNPNRREVLSSHMGGKPRIALENEGLLRRICDQYGELLRRQGFGGDVPAYRFDRLSTGEAIDNATRRIARLALLAAEDSGEDLPPDPFHPATAQAFRAWLQAETPPASLPRYLMAHYAARADLRAAYPDLAGVDGPRLRAWAADGVSRGEPVIPSLLRPDSRSLVRSTVTGMEDRLRRAATSHPRLARAKPLYRHAQRVIRRSSVHDSLQPQTTRLVDLPGVNVAGYLRAELGVGEAARRLIRGLDAARVPYTTYVYERTRSRQLHPFKARPEHDDVYDTNLVCVNADELPNFRADVGTEFFDGRYTIGLWFWEVSRFPASLATSFDLVDEIWVASDFIRESVACMTTKPVVTVPLPIEPVEPGRRSRLQLGLPDTFLFLFSFDYLSVFERKNPLGLIDAFDRAFEPGEGPALMIKTINGDSDPASRDRLEACAQKRPDVIVRDGYVDADERNSLVAACDCYVSLHRSEGYGLTMAEAMAVGKPVIATAYSGNLAFMDESNSYLVPFDLEPIPPGCGPYPTSGVWAEPDIGAAAELMRRVWRQPDEALALAAGGRANLIRRYSPETTGAEVAARLETIRSSRVPQRRVPPMPGHALVTGYSHTPISVARRFARRLLWPELIDQRRREGQLAAAIVGLGHRLDVTARDCRTEANARLAASNRQQVEVEALRSEMLELYRSFRKDDDRNLSPRPYVADHDLIYTTDERGESAIGFEAGAPTTEGTYRAFEAIFRGPEDFIRERQRFYIPLLAEHAPVLDTGCGRGELLELLREAGIYATGVDIDPAMVDRCRDKALDVVLGDLTTTLQTTESESLGAVFAAHVIEHLPSDELMSFFALAHRVLRPGGVLVAETVNPHSFPAFKMFWIDPTHQGPIYPEVSVALCRINGFTSARVIFPQGVGVLETDRQVQSEYAVVAYR